MDGQQNGAQQPDEPAWQFKPGETISPRNHEQPITPQSQPVQNPSPVQPESAAPVVAPSQPVPPVESPVVPVASIPEPQAPQPQPATLAPSQPALPAEPTPSAPAQDVSYWQGEPNNSISWTASEFVDHTKTTGWHLLLLGGSVLFALIVWFFTKDLVSAFVVIVAGGVLSFYGSRKPQQVQYQLSNHGLSIGQRNFSFEAFTAFSVMPEGAFSSIALFPSKRFAPLVSIFYDPEDEDKILDILGAYLPRQDKRVDAVDALMRRIRF